MKKQNRKKKKNGKKKWIAVLAVFVAVVLLAVGAGIWYTAPKVFLKGVAPEEVAKIEVFDGNTGESFTISQADEIKYIVENIQSVETRKEKLSSGYEGYRFKLSFYGWDGEELTTFIVNGATTIRKDPFFYKNEDGGLCYEYLEFLEFKYAVLGEGK